MNKEETKKELRKILYGRIREENGIEQVADSLTALIEELAPKTCDNELKEVFMLVLQIANEAPNLSALNRPEQEEIDRSQLLDLE